MAEAAPAWKRVAGSFLVSTHGDCILVGRHLFAALRDLESADLLQNRDGARYVLLDSARHQVEEASWTLSIAMSGMVAIEYLTLRGCGAVPTHPVASVGDLKDGADAYSNVCLALVRLQSAREYGQNALRATEAAFSHLWAAQLLSSRIPAAAGRHAAMESQVDDATRRIRDAMRDVTNMNSLVCIANQPPARIRSRQS